MPPAPLRRARSPRFVLALAAIGLLAGGAASAQNSPIELTVDARQAPIKIVKTDETLPVQPGPLTLYYPKWIPGEHAPDGPIMNLTGLKITGNGQLIPWRRDLLDVFTFHVDIPAGVHRLHIHFDYLEPSGGPYSEGASATDKLVIISWNQNVLYPAGTPAQDLIYRSTLILPKGWKHGTALPQASEHGQTIVFKPVALNRLVDSPVIAGQYYRAYNITPPGEPIHHEIDIVGDSWAAVQLKPELQHDLTNLVYQAGKLFGARHYRDYHFLFTVSDHVAHFGLEHHESDDSRLPEGVLEGPQAGLMLGELLPHEYVHSWNGKFRRPLDLSSAYYEAPMKTDLLWVYEGLTDFLGNVLATRSGLWTQADYQQWIADISAELGPGRPGRTWRDLLDTAVAVPGESGFAPGWLDWRRGTDYYEEGDLLWLEVDTIIHRVTHGQKGIDDFCKYFYGGPNLGPQLKPYTFDQLVAALNHVAPYDWAAFFHRRLDSLSPLAPVKGVEAAGWKTVYTMTPAPAGRGFRGGINAAYSIGLEMGNSGQVFDSIVGSPAFDAGITSGMQVVGVNDRKFTPQVFNNALKATAMGHSMTLLYLNDDYYGTAHIRYDRGPRYPHLVREPGVKDFLDNDILRPR
ncbi:MAG: M61 family peptidase [Terriglobales bacterium]